MLGRIGLFFFLVGILIVFISLAAGKANSDSLKLFCIGAPSALLGITLWFRARDRTPAERFKILRRNTSKNGSGEIKPGHQEQ
jgi:hypothetical protein